MAKIYVTHEVNMTIKAYDFRKAEQYGEIIFVTRNDMNNTKGSLENKALMSEIRMALHKFNPDEDYLLIAGSPYVTALVFIVLGRRRIPRINFLRWSNRDLLYTPVTIELAHGVEHSLT